VAVNRVNILSRRAPALPVAEVVLGGTIAHILQHGPMIAGMLGVHFAITSEQERSLLAADDEGDRDAVAELLEEIEEFWDDDALKVDTDKAWDAIHRCLTDGTLDFGQEG
jgi:hypothetical protein